MTAYHLVVSVHDGKAQRSQRWMEHFGLFSLFGRFGFIFFNTFCSRHSLSIALLHRILDKLTFPFGIEYRHIDDFKTSRDYLLAAVHVYFSSKRYVAS